MGTTEVVNEKATPLRPLSVALATETITTLSTRVLGEDGYR